MRHETLLHLGPFCQDDLGKIFSFVKEISCDFCLEPLCTKCTLTADRATDPLSNWDVDFCIRQMDVSPDK